MISVNVIFLLSCACVMTATVMAGPVYPSFSWNPAYDEMLNLGQRMRDLFFGGSGFPSIPNSFARAGIPIPASFSDIGSFNPFQPAGSGTGPTGPQFPSTPGNPDTGMTGPRFPSIPGFPDTGFPFMPYNPTGAGIPASKDEVSAIMAE